MAAPAVAQDATLEGEARALYEAGAAAYAGGRYGEALAHFQRSYELSGRPELLNNIGSAAERDRQDELAVESYERFLAEVPDTPIRPRVERRIEALRRLLAEAREAPEASTGPAETQGPAAGSPADDGGAGPAPWIVVGIGAAVAVVGGVLLGIGLADRSAVETPGAGAIWTDETQASYERGPALLTSGAILLPVGVVAVAAGVVWAVVSLGDGGDAASVAFGPGTVELRGRF
ncbi:MAG: hypothetical protein H6719_12255 [Sandaracinaceae bacterium]|nr:hypothetical protein [Sandaracinaceae bacterium]